MSRLIVAGQDIESYLPANTSNTTRERIWRIALEVAERIEQNLTLSFQYNGQSRLVAPASLYLQESTRSATRSIAQQGKRMRVTNPGASKTIAMDALEIIPKTNEVGGWKSFHLDRIDNLRILDEVETMQAFPNQNKNIISSIIRAQFPKKGGFVRNWQSWYRTPIVEAASE